MFILGEAARWKGKVPEMFALPDFALTHAANGSGASRDLDQFSNQFIIELEHGLRLPSRLRHPGRIDR